jgi:nitrate/TMAO reductase-like tetraheme cytochrome c subunit
METVTLVRMLGTVVCLIGIVLCWYITRTRFDALSSDKAVSVANVTLTQSAFWKLLAFVGIVLVPLAAIGLANYHTLEGTHKVSACASCHVMLPMVNDMKNAASNTLAARHFKNHWIPENQCYECHSDYGLNGNLEAKMEGYRHLARYTTRTYQEPIKIRGYFHNDNCLKCHQDMPLFEAVKSHQSVRVLLDTSSMSCLNCHGQAHPSRAQRTPGSADYTKLLEAGR